MKILKIPILVITLILLLSQSASAQPTFQVWSPDWDFVGDYMPPDQDTWYVTTSNPFDLWVVGAYHSNTIELQDVKLLLSVPNGQQGSISITYGTQLLVPVITTDVGNADVDVFDDGSNTGYSKTSLFYPDNFNNHYPLHDGVSDFLLYDLGTFANNIDDIYDYNADNGGSITPTGAKGEVKEYTVAVSGFSWVHFDAYGLEIKAAGKNWKTSWDMAPGSHDVTFIPAPGAVLLGGIGVCLVGWLRRRRIL